MENVMYASYLDSSFCRNVVEDKNVRKSSCMGKVLLNLLIGKHSDPVFGASSVNPRENIVWGTLTNAIEIDSIKKSEKLKCRPRINERARIIRLPEVINRIGLSRSSIYKFISEGNFPKKVSLGARAMGFYEHEIDEWINNRGEAQ